MKFDPVPLVKGLFSVLADMPIEFGNKPPPLEYEKYTSREAPMSLPSRLIRARYDSETKPPEKGTACIPCSRDHISTAAGVLSEALRFARSGGLSDPEALDRLDLAEEELNALERVDASPAKLLNLPPKEKELMQDILPRVRDLRHGIQRVGSLEDLEATAAAAHMLAQELRLRVLRTRGIDLTELKDIADKTEKGEISRDKAREQVRNFLVKAEGG